MINSLFPNTFENNSAGENPLDTAVEVAWDFEKDLPIFARGEPVEVRELEAVKVWVWNCLKTERFRFRHHSRSFGSEMYRLMGQTFSGEVKVAEAARYFREALLENPYITGIENISVEMDGESLSVSGKMNTIYGTAEVNGSV